MKTIRRKNYLINRVFQLGHAANMVLLQLLVAAVTAGIVAWVCLFVLNQRLICELDSDFFLKGGIIVTFMTVGVAIWAIRYTHAIAGPVFKTCRTLQSAAAGSIPATPVFFRRGDLFQNLAADLNRVLEVMRSDRRVLDGLQQELAAIEKISRDHNLDADERLAQIEAALAVVQKPEHRSQ